MTSWANILAEVRRSIKETTADHWTDPELLSRANDGIRDIVRRTHCLQDHNLQTLTDGTRAYSFPSGCLGPPIEVRVKASSSDDYYQSCAIVGKSQLNSAARAWEDEEDSPRICYFQMGKVYLVPEPDTTIASGLDIWYIQNPTDLSATTSKPWKIGTTAQAWLNGYNHLIVRYIVWQCFLEDGDINAADRWGLLYQNGVNQMEKDIRGGSKKSSWGFSRRGNIRSWLEKLES